jgi:hypothetical protein
VEPSLAAEQTDACEVWVSFHGKQYCSPQLDEPFGGIESERYDKHSAVRKAANDLTAHTNYHSTAHSATARLYPRYYTPISRHHNSRHGTVR